MKRTLLTLFILINYVGYSQNLTCKDFKNGTFIVPKDSISPITYKIIRKGNTQIELATNLHEIDPNLLKTYPHLKDKFYETIEWIDDCTYKLKYDVTKMKMSDELLFINNHGGLLTELIKIEGNCFYYKSTLNVNGEIQRVDGKFCKE